MITKMLDTIADMTPALDGEPSQASAFVLPAATTTWMPESVTFFTAHI